MNRNVLCGSGNYIITGIKTEGKEGVGIFWCPNHGNPINSIAPEPELKDLLCIISFNNMAGARMFQDQVNAAVLRMQKFIVENEGAKND